MPGWRFRGLVASRFNERGVSSVLTLLRGVTGLAGANSVGYVCRLIGCLKEFSVNFLRIAMFLLAVVAVVC